MRCECCDKLLTDAEATAKFTESGNYVSMCGECIEFLPKNIKISKRADLEKEDSNSYEQFFDEDYFDDEE